MVLVTWQLQRNRVNREKKRNREEAQTFSWVTGLHKNTPSGWGNGWGSRRGRWIGTERRRKGSEKWERAQKEREKKAQAGCPHIAHSYLIWLSFPYSTFHDSLCFSPQKQPKVDSAAAVCEFRCIAVGADIEQRCWWMITVWATSQIAQQWLCITTGLVSFFCFLNKIFQDPARYYLNSHITSKPNWGVVC